MSTMLIPDIIVCQIVNERDTSIDNLNFSLNEREQSIYGRRSMDVFLNLIENTFIEKTMSTMLVPDTIILDTFRNSPSHAHPHS